MDEVLAEGNLTYFYASTFVKQNLGKKMKTKQPKKIVLQCNQTRAFIFHVGFVFHRISVDCERPKQKIQTAKKGNSVKSKNQLGRKAAAGRI